MNTFRRYFDLNPITQTVMRSLPAIGAIGGVGLLGYGAYQYFSTENDDMGYYYDEDDYYDEDGEYYDDEDYDEDDYDEYFEE